MLKENHILTEIHRGVGWITLNRPRALNALSYEMVTELEQIFMNWKDDDQVSLIYLEGAGERGLCAGGDIRSLYDRRDADIIPFATPYFQSEYRMDYLIHHYPKPVIAIMDGYVMGGGVGISNGASLRMVTEKTKWAMPEMNIGFFPDVGASYFLSQMPGSFGTYLALTAETITAADVLFLGAADYYVQSERLADLKQAVQQEDWTTVDSLEQGLDRLVKRFSESSPLSSTLKQAQDKVNHHFSLGTIEAILQSLKQAAKLGDTWAEEKARTLEEKSPTSLKIALEQIKRGRTLSLGECFQMEINLGMNFMVSDDFHEGVRAVVVDKDRRPRWNPPTLEEVSEEDVLRYFHYDWGKEGNPLKMLK
ncbi:enoyl-CoA hydratase/isomerase family protein [Ammoniphilus sp. CFH 90114]|uniref:enoyl-CoA hydratase/isomerase family protein n=1 Tax=Ammoniphilus sp. CFH 90114 TaxID=2493665 RepID=UPI001F0C7ACB|nr:enoyl-CoA hydratase/isomerase family protein [Ammoniphilus sp. CFH 90114]